MRVILDTNILISYLISSKLTFIDDVLESNKVDLIFSNQLIEEFKNVAKRKHFQKYFESPKLEQLISHLYAFGILIDPSSTINICRDPDDNFLLELAFDGDADYLITGDKDLLVIESIKHCKIINLRDFQEIINPS